MKLRTKTILAGLGMLLSASGCGDNADGETVSLSVDRSEILWSAGNPAPTRITDWIGYTTTQRADQPYDPYEEYPSYVGNVEIVFTVNAANEAFDDPWWLDEQGERINPVNFIDMDGKQQTSPFITKTDDTGRYILGVHVLVTGCVEYGVELEARVMGETVRTHIEIESDIDDADFPALCIGE